ncbi:MAG: hypothetical protein KKF48_03965 [Nanoarchaeota archaeon]|nr:hypothetical protein [Nanoarchaeota archaeon]MBU1028174.1 hypothetical protein [Nanoarchaeota archaeon]
MKNELNKKLTYCEPLPNGLKMIGCSVYVDTKDITLKEVLTFKESLFEYLKQIERKLDDYLLNQFRK